MRSLALSLKLLFLFFGTWEMNQNCYSTFKLVFDYASGSAGDILPETGRALVTHHFLLPCQLVCFFLSTAITSEFCTY